MNKNLHNAKQKKDDEFYTSYDTVSRIFDLIKDSNIDISGGVDLPFDNYESNFAHYCVYNDIPFTLDNKFDYENFNYKHKLVISNPPFSKFRSIVKFFITNDIKFILIGSNNATTYKDILNWINEDKIFVIGDFKQKVGFTRPDGSIKNVAISIFSSFPLNFKRDYHYTMIDDYKVFDRTTITDMEQIEINKCAFPITVFNFPEYIKYKWKIKDFDKKYKRVVPYEKK